MTRRGFTMVEAAVSVVVVSVMLCAALDTVAASRAGQVWNSESLRALALASALMGEITDQYYKDPNNSTLTLGPDPGENQSIRTTLNDVDDYNGLDGVPTNRDGTAIPGLSNWRRTVTVNWASSANLSSVGAGDTGVKRITVSVYRGSVRLAKLVAFRTAAVPR